MRRILGVLIGISLMGVLVAGCGQQTPSINTSNSQPSGLSIRGTIYTTTISGTIGDPISGAVVTLSGDSASYTSVTNSRGEYVFSSIPDGSYNLAVTAEGHKRDTSTAVNVALKPSSDVPADNTITVQDIQLDSNPIITTYSPVPNTVISQSPTFVVTFNEAMDTSTVIPGLVAQGVRTFAISGDTVSLSTSWSSDGKTLTMTPEASLISNESYTLSVNYGGAARDAAGYALEVTGDQALASTQTYRVTTGGVPAAPSNITVTVNSKPFTSESGTGANYLDVYTSGNSVRIYCDPPSSGGLVTGYKFYAAIDAASAGNYVLLGSDTDNYFTLTVANLITALYNGTVDPVTTRNYPFINKAVYFKAVAYNGDGESSAASIGPIKELLGPNVDSDAYSGRTGGGYTAELLNNNYYLPGLTAGTDTKIAYIAFIEPVDPATIIAGNFTHSAGTVTDATLLTSASSNLGAFWLSLECSIVKITSDTDFAAAQTITVGSGVKDLAGNATAAGEIATVQ